MLTKSMFMKMKHEIKWSSSMSPSIQVLHQQINGGEGSQCVHTALMQGGRGWGSKILENMLTSFLIAPLI